MGNLFGFISGLVFGIGLILAGMADPLKVKGFLDLAGAWDPSLALVMGGAIALGIVASPLRAMLAGKTLRPDVHRLLFIVGLLVAPWVWRIVAKLPAATVDVGPAALLVAGLLVGVGVRMGNGCTSGHGVCGLSRFSGRSLVNVLAFMGAGFATVFVLRHVV